MSISVQHFVKVNIAVAPNSIATDGFGPLIFLTEEYKPTLAENPVLMFGSMSEVTDQFPGGEINMAASLWYGQVPTPKTFYVGALRNALKPVAATSGSVTAKTAAVLADLKAITSGTLTLAVDGQMYEVDNIDLSEAADLDAVVVALGVALGTKGVPAMVSQAAGKFSITSNSTGASSYVGDVSGTVGTALKLTEIQEAILVNGTDAKNFNSDMQSILDSGAKFFYVTIDRVFRDKPLQEQAARWAQSNQCVFGWSSSDKNVLIMNRFNSFKKAKSLQLMNTLCVYDPSPNGNEYPECSIFARAATVNFNVRNSVLILAFKKGPGCTVANLSTGQLAALESYNGNAFIDVAGNAMFHNGKMADGTWFDTVQGTSWLTSHISNGVFNLFHQTTTRIPWTDGGVGVVNQRVALSLELARTNGLIAPGYDNEGNFYPNGYAVFSTPLELLQGQKGARIWEGTSFIAIGSGALQGAVISGNFIQ